MQLVVDNPLMSKSDQPIGTRKRVIGEGFAPKSPSIFQSVASVLERVFDARLVVPEGMGDVSNLKRDKQFCVGLLENPVSHTWWPNLERLGSRERWSISGTMFLLRKVLPCPPDPDQADKHARLMRCPAPIAPTDMMSSFYRQIDGIFPIGWDRSYQSHVFNHTPTSSSCLEFPASAGGCRTYMGRRGVDWFRDACLSEVVHPSEYPVKYSVVNTGGKNRGITVSSGYSSILGPLHRTLYSFLSQQDWILRGDAKENKFKPFHSVEGEVFVSGDYESATDNLSLSVTERILLRILSRARYVPESLKLYALTSLRATISYPGGRVVQQQRGQLMGNYLSFPLLCIQNYLAFKYYVPRSVPVRINGDDIVFRCRRSEYESWAKGVGSAGLTLSKGKTLVDRRFFSLNSAFFEAQRGRRPRVIPVLRASMLRPSDGLPSGDSFSKFLRGWKGSSRRLAGGLWLQLHKPSILASGRSVVRGLGIPADNSQLFTASLHQRESFFRGRRFDLPECPIPPAPHDFSDRRRRLGYSFVKCALWANRREMDGWASDSLGVFQRLAWEPDVERASCVARRQRWQAWWEEVRSTGKEDIWRRWRASFGRKIRLFRGLGLALREVPLREVSREGVWIPTDVVPQYRCRRVGVGWF
nr:MAG: RNA-dependent RNA polymerase [Dracophyllum associated botourmia-like virus 30]